MASPSSACKDLRMMLLGLSGVGKSATANAILGTEAFKETKTIQCEIQSRIVERRNISVIDTPGMENTLLITEEWRTELKKGLMLSSPGLHAFLLVINVEKEEEKLAVRCITENFGEEALKYTMILFIGREEIANRQWVKFTENVRTKDLISCCGGRYCVINSKKEVNPTQVSKLLEEIEAMVQQNGNQVYTQEMYEAADRIRTTVTQEKEKMKKRNESKPKANQDACLEVQKKDADTGNHVKIGNVILPKKKEEPVKSHPVIKEDMKVKFVKENLRRQEKTRREIEQMKWMIERGVTGGINPDPVCDLRILLLGGVGAGKSSSGNTILGREAFGEEMIKVNTMGRRQDGLVGNKSITVVDTKGYSNDFWKYCEDLKEHCFKLCKPGPHVFVLVVPSPKSFSFPVHLLYERFGPEVLKRTLVLITYGDSLGRDHRAVLNNNSELKQLI